jgi:pantothenate kinase-related protein Tda10
MERVLAWRPLLYGFAGNNGSGKSTTQNLLDHPELIVPEYENGI